MKRGVIFSALLHLTVIWLLFFGFPFSVHREWDSTPVNVDITEMSEVVQAPHPVLHPTKGKEPLPPSPEEKAAEPVPLPEPEPTKVSEPVAEPEPGKAPDSMPEPVSEKAPSPAPDPIPEKAPDPDNSPDPVLETPEKPEVIQPEQKPVEKLPVKEAPPLPVQKPRLKKKLQDQKPVPQKETSNFESVLKNLEKFKDPISEDDPKETDEKAKTSAKQGGMVGEKITANEIAAIRRQLSQCWNIPAGAKEARDLVVKIKVSLNKDGTVRSARVVEGGAYRQHPFYQMASESALRAVQDPRCNPLKLPPHKYHLWKEMILSFNPKDLLGP